MADEIAHPNPVALEGGGFATVLAQATRLREGPLQTSNQTALSLVAEGEAESSSATLLGSSMVTSAPALELLVPGATASETPPSESMDDASSTDTEADAHGSELPATEQPGLNVGLWATNLVASLVASVMPSKQAPASPAAPPSHLSSEIRAEAGTGKALGPAPTDRPQGPDILSGPQGPDILSGPVGGIRLDTLGLAPLQAEGGAPSVASDAPETMTPLAIASSMRTPTGGPTTAEGTSPAVLAASPRVVVLSRGEEPVAGAEGHHQHAQGTTIPAATASLTSLADQPWVTTVDVIGVPTSTISAPAPGAHAFVEALHPGMDEVTSADDVSLVGAAWPEAPVVATATSERVAALVNAGPPAPETTDATVVPDEQGGNAMESDAAPGEGQLTMEAAAGRSPAGEGQSNGSNASTAEPNRVPGTTDRAEEGAEIEAFASTAAMNHAAAARPLTPLHAAAREASMWLHQPMVEQLSRGVEMAVERPGQAVHLRLHPEGLGSVTLEVGMYGSEVHVHIAVDNPGTRDLIQSTWSNLTRTLNDQGLNIAGAQVEVTGGQTQGGWQGERSDGGSPQRGGRAQVTLPSTEEAAAGPWAATTASAGRVDYRV